MTMRFATFKFISFAMALAIPSQQGALGILSNCPKGLCLTDAISCLAGAKPNSATSVLNCPKGMCLTDAFSCLAGAKMNSDQTKTLGKLEKEVASLKAELAKAGKPSGFAMLDSNGRLPQNLLVAGYDKYSAYDLAWQSLHMAAAAACRGSTRSGGSGPVANAVMVRNTPDKRSCNQICGLTQYRNCDAEVSISGNKGKATQNGKIVGVFYNYPCGHADNGGSEVSRSNEDIMYGPFSSFCCCRK